MLFKLKSLDESVVLDKKGIYTYLVSRGGTSPGLQGKFR